MINLNDSAFDAKQGTAIFNDGVAGVVDNVAISVNKRKPEDKENSPEYKLTFTDSKGAACNTSFWYVDKATQYKTVEDQIKTQGTVLKHILHAIYGSDYQFPSFNTTKEMLDGCMKLIREGLASGLKFRIFANYGSTQSIKSYIQPRSWVPFMEPMSVSISETRLKAGNIDAMARVEKDNVAPTNNTAMADSIIEGDDW
jgi:hypothetical protein